jgi:hypothetical protein
VLSTPSTVKQPSPIGLAIRGRVVGQIPLARAIEIHQVNVGLQNQAVYDILLHDNTFHMGIITV